LSLSRIILVGNPDEVHVGAHLRNAAATLGVEAHFFDSTRAFEAPGWRRRVDWWTRGRRPTRLREFSDGVVRAAQELRPGAVLTTGIAPVDAAALRVLRGLGVLSLNFLTDDPWNPAHRAPWFMDALAQYDWVFSPRQANLADLASLEGPRVHYLQFAYAPEVHFPERLSSEAERRRYEADVMFAGGADADRVALVSTLTDHGLQVALYGGYWDKDAATRPHARGFVDAAGLRKATNGAAVCLCLVRRANRDGHSMRTFEIPAMDGCLLIEDTTEHRALFGEEDQAVVYFRSADEAASQAAALVNDEARRRRLAAASYRLVTAGPHTYADRLSELLRVAGEAHTENRSGRSRTLSRV
jgi:hypothetical protein